MVNLSDDRWRLQLTTQSFMCHTALVRLVVHLIIVVLICVLCTAVVHV